MYTAFTENAVCQRGKKGASTIVDLRSGIIEIIIAKVREDIGDGIERETCSK